MNDESPFIFFVDMDGVLNNPRVCYSRPRDKTHDMYGWIDPISVAFINKWADYINVHYEDEVNIVMTSTWRSMFENHNSISTFFSVMGVCLRVHPDFKTRRTEMSVNGNRDIRGYQIDDWLRKHPSTKNWLVIDDDNDFLGYQLERHVRTDQEDGILGRHHRQALEIIDKIYEGKI